MEYYIRAKTLNKVHSPALFELVSFLFDFEKRYYADDAVEGLIDSLSKDRRLISMDDHGAGSHKSSLSNRRSIASIVKSASSSKWKGRLLRNLVLYAKPSCILELGTNLGVGTAYLASADDRIEMHTIEAASELVKLAQVNLQQLGLEAVFHNQLFRDFLQSNQKLMGRSDFVYLDGHHEHSATLAYFELLWSNGPDTQMIVVDDINWSEGMRRAWADIKDGYDCWTLDLYKLGVVLKRPQFSESHHIACLPRWMKPLQLGLFN